MCCLGIVGDRAALLSDDRALVASPLLEWAAGAQTAAEEDAWQHAAYDESEENGDQ